MAYRELDSGTDEFLGTLLKNAGVLADCCGSLLRRRREWNGEEAWFLINPQTQAVKESISKDGFSNVVDLLGGNLLEQTADSLTVQVDGSNLACLLLR